MNTHEKTGERTGGKQEKHKRETQEGKQETQERNTLEKT